MNKNPVSFHPCVIIYMNEKSFERMKYMDKPAAYPVDKETIQSISKLFKVISDPTRLSILFLLQSEELSVGNIATSLDMEQSAVSHQLKTLKDSRLVKAKRAGKIVIYSLDDYHVFSILEQVSTHIEEEKIKD